MKKHITLLLLCFTLTNLGAQQIAFEHISVEQGLSHPFVQDIYQDSYGILWIATRQGGLNKYDGISFTSYKFHPNNPNSISSNRVSHIYEDRDSNLWIAATGAINFYERDKDRFIKFYPNDNYKWGKVDNSTNCSFQDKEGNIWIGTSRGIVKMIFDKDNPLQCTFEHFGTLRNNKYTNLNRVYSINEIGEYILAGTLDGLSYKHKNDTLFKNLPLKELNEEGQGERVNRIYVNENECWISIRSFIVKLELKDGKLAWNKNIDWGRGNATITNFEVDDKGNFWLTTYNGVLQLTLQNGKWTSKHYVNDPNNTNSLSNNISLSIVIDNANIVWIATTNGINKYDPNQHLFKAYSSKTVSNFVSREIRNFYQLDSSLYFIISQSNIFLFDKNDESFTQLPKSRLSNAQLRDFKRYKNDVFLLATYGPRNAGMYRCIIPESCFKTKDFSKMTSERIVFSEDGMRKGNNNFIKQIYIDNDGIVWFTSRFGGLGRVEFEENYRTGKAKVSQYLPDSKNPKSIGIDNTEILTADDKNRLWIGTRGAGISIFDKNNETFSNYGQQEGINGNEALALLIDKQTVYIGNSSSGIQIVDNNAQPLATLNVENGSLLDNNIAAIEKDSNGNIWFTSPKGISKYLPENEKIIHYSLENGMHGYDFLPSVSLTDSYGNLFFGGSNGFTFIDNEVTNKLFTYKPTVLLTNLWIKNKLVKLDSSEKSILTKPLYLSDKLIIKAENNDFQIDFAASCYALPNKNKYQFRLLGSKQNWVTVNADRAYAKYSNLRAGDYIFQVKAANFEGLWGDQITELPIKVYPPFYKSWWFISLMVIIVLFIFYRILKWREKQAKVIQERLEQQVAERTAALKMANADLQEQKEEILTQNEEIQQQAEELETQKDALAERNEAISQSFKRFEMLSEFGQKITATLDIDSIYNMIFSYASSVIDISAFGIGLYDETEELIYYPKFVNGDEVEENVTKSLSDAKSLTSLCFNKQEVIFINDIEQEAEKFGLNIKEIANIAAARSRIHIPLTVENKKMGLLVINSSQANAYSKEDLTNMQTLASYISIALDNAKAYDTIHEINKNTEKSINYASTIQNAFLPQPKTINDYINAFVLFKPKDIVSGDFYWFLPVEENPEKPVDIIIAAMDCTGHGVPGALMSLVGNSQMREIIVKDKIYQPAEILTQLNDGVKSTLKQETTGNNDGMDATLARIQQLQDNTFKICFGGAKNPLVIIKANGTLEIIKGSRYSIGGAKLRKEKIFEQQEITLEKNDQIYLFSDGYADQNGPDREKFGRDNMLNLLQENAQLSIPEQQQKLEEALYVHQQNAEQRDDITIIGIKL